MPPLLMRRPSASCCDIRPMTADGSRQTLPLQRQMGGSRGAQRRKSMRREIPAQAGHHTCPTQRHVILFFTLFKCFFLTASPARGSTGAPPGRGRRGRWHPPVHLFVFPLAALLAGFALLV